MIDSIRYNFESLSRFSGRDGRGRFWPYAGAVFVLACLSIWLVMAPIFETLGRIRQFAREHPEEATIVSGPGYYYVSIEGAHPELMPDFEAMMYGIAAVTAVTALLLAAAVTRRLHDRGRSGAWELVPLILLVTGFFGMNIFINFGTGALPAPGLLFLIFLNNLLYLASLVLLVIQLASAGTRGPNRFGAGAE